MSKEFKPGLVYVFTRKKFVKSSGDKDAEWSKKVNGRKVQTESWLIGTINRELWIVPKWCKCIGRERRIKN